MKKILIFYAAYGGGHLSAAKSIKQYIDEHFDNVETQMIDCVKYVNKALDKVTTTAYKEMAKKAPWAWEKVYYKSQTGLLAKVSNTSNKIMAVKIAKLFREYNPDVVISTHPFGSQMTSYLKKKGKTNCTLATIMTDFAPHDQWLVGSENVDFYFVSNENMKNIIVQNNNIPESKIFVTGIPISNRFLQTYNKEEILKNFELSESKKTILFFGGGEYGLKTYSKQESITVLPFTDKVPELMAISDLVITKPGGLTTSESLASSLPILVINPIPGQEEENAEFLENSGCAIWIRKDSNPDEIINLVLGNEEKLNEMRKNSIKLAKKNSTRDICEICLSSLRKGEKND